MNDLNIIFSPEVISHFKKITNSSSLIRIGLEKSGCSGYKYILSIDNNKELKSEEQLFLINDLSFIVNKNDLPYFNNCILSLKKEGLNQKIVFDNPNAMNHCGCGESFNLT